ARRPGARPPTSPRRPATDPSPPPPRVPPATSAPILPFARRLLTSIPTVFKYLRYESSPVPRRTERPQPRPAAERGAPGVPGAGLLRGDPGPDRRRDGLLQGPGGLALPHQRPHVPGP